MKKYILLYWRTTFLFNILKYNIKWYRKLLKSNIQNDFLYKKVDAGGKSGARSDENIHFVCIVASVTGRVV